MLGFNARSLIKSVALYDVVSFPLVSLSYSIIGCLDEISLRCGSVRNCGVSHAFDFRGPSRTEEAAGGRPRQKQPGLVESRPRPRPEGAGGGRTTTATKRERREERGKKRKKEEEAKKSKKRQKN